MKSQKKKKWISSDQTLATIREKREAKGKDKNRYQELKLMCSKLKEDKQQYAWLELEGMCVELEAAIELKRKFQATLPDSQINDSKVPA